MRALHSVTDEITSSCASWWRHGTQAALARAAGVSVQTVARARRGFDGFLTDATLGRLLALDGSSSLEDFPWSSRASLVAEG